MLSYAWQFCAWRTYTAACSQTVGHTDFCHIPLEKNGNINLWWSIIWYGVLHDPYAMHIRS